MTKSRVTLPGFGPLRQDDTDRHQVEIGTIQSGGHMFVVRLQRSHDIGEDAPFVVSHIYEDGSCKNALWSFTHLRDAGFKGYAFLASAGEETVIALCLSGRTGSVTRVLPPPKFNDVDDIGRRIILKRQAAAFLGRDLALDEEEKLVINVISKRDREAAAAAERAREMEREEARRLKIQKIQARRPLVAYAADGSRRTGFPVAGDDWRCLPRDVRVVLVPSYNEETGEVGSGDWEAFKIFRKGLGSNAEKQDPSPVTAQPPAAHKADIGPKPVKTLVFEINGKFRRALLFASADDLKAAKEAGLNGGTYVTSPPAKDGDPHEVSELKESPKGVKQHRVGKFHPLTL